MYGGQGADRLLDDLWRFNGDIVAPEWHRILPTAVWPPPLKVAGQGGAWTEPGALWLATATVDPLSGADSLPAVAKDESLWLFIVETSVWQRVGRPAALETGAEDVGWSRWPTSREVPLTEAGWLFGGVGEAECAGSTSTGGSEPAEVAALTGLWRWSTTPWVGQ